METKAKDLVLWENDPILYLFKEKLGFSDLRITLWLTAIFAIVYFGLGWIADRSYTGRGIRFIDPEFSYFTLVFVFIFMPLALGLYVWQPSAITSVLQSFEQFRVVQSISEKGNRRVESYPGFLVRFKMAVDRKIWVVIAAISIIGVWILEGFVVLPSLFSAIGRSAFWYDVKWFLVVSSLIFSVWIYAAAMIFLRQIQAIVYLNHLFQWFNIRIHPMHPDEAGGLGALGNFTLKASSIMVGIGVVVAVLSIHQWLVGSNPFTRADLVIFWVGYILGVPISLILPMLSAHRAMQEVRNKKLNEISQEFEKTLSESNVTEVNDAEAIKKANEKLKELQTRYNIVAESFPTWPVPARLFRGFSITASLPVMSGLISMAINFATQ